MKCILIVHKMSNSGCMQLFGRRVNGPVSLRVYLRFVNKYAVLFLKNSHLNWLNVSNETNRILRYNMHHFQCMKPTVSSLNHRIYSPTNSTCMEIQSLYAYTCTT